MSKRHKEMKSTLDFENLSINDSDKYETVFLQVYQDVESRFKSRTDKLEQLNAALREEIDRRREADEVLTRQNQYLPLLHETTLGLINRLDVADLLKAIINRAAELVGTPHGFIYLVDDEQSIIERKVGTGIYQQDIGRRMTTGEGLAGRVFQTGNYIVIDNYANWERRLDACLFNQVCAVLQVPLKSENKVIGTIGLAFLEAGRKFESHEIYIVSRFAELASIALDNARLHTALKQELAERERMEEQLRFLSLHDALTGLYNRTYYEQQMRLSALSASTSAGMIICDLDGLKLINDTLGHEAGDMLLVTMGDILRRVFGQEGTVARIGGDEFAILLPVCTLELLESYRLKIQKAVQDHNTLSPGFPLSVSVGSALSNEHAQDMRAVFREADNNMYREKLHQDKSVRSTIVQALTKALEARDFNTQGHVERMQWYAEKLALKLSLPERTVAEISLLAHFHDIGKVGISDAILFKNGPLTEEEFSEMQRHSEIGYRIAKSIPDLYPIADWILKHHEWWNGQGYPLNIKEGEIPLECRIIALADAFDAMTSDRPYRKAMSIANACSELRKCAGTQFDPNLVEAFIETVLELGIC